MVATLSRSLGIFVPLVLGASALTACSSGTQEEAAPEVLCSAVGWSDSLSVTLEGASSAVADVKLCLAGDCYPGPREDVDASGFAATGLAQRGDANSAWVFSMFDTPDGMTVRTYDAQGSILTEEPIVPEWRRVGGSEECGGPRHADVAIDL